MTRELLTVNGEQLFLNLLGLGAVEFAPVGHGENETVTDIEPSLGVLSPAPFLEANNTPFHIGVLHLAKRGAFP
jgi:hypothetical protein